MGRVENHRVSHNNRDTRKRKYEWDVNQRLRSITDELNNKVTSFSYDEFSNLVKADYGFNDILYRETDEVGNLYETADKSDRIYGKGSRLEQSGVNTNELKNKYQGGHGKLVTKGAQYQYDGEGNLIKKIEAPHPDAWVYGKKGERVYSPSPVLEYEYYGNGMLKKVIKPDGETVSFKYDSLGRRIEKSSNSKIIKFVWDGNNPLHEWEENVEKPRFNRDSLVTWIFKDNFVPSAKLTNQGSYSIISDHLGTPVEAYDQDGKKVWEQELDIYGRVRKRPTRNVYGAKIDDGMKPDNFIPFRYQGQYEDEETGLFYNRFRYYSPELGQYISQDPIGLAGGNPTLYGYVHNPNWWIDPLGLNACDGDNNQNNDHGINAENLELGPNAAHSDRPYQQSTLLIEELLNFPGVDPQGSNGHWFEAPGSLLTGGTGWQTITPNQPPKGASSGTWELLINPEGTTIWHFLFRGN